MNSEFKKFLFQFGYWHIKPINDHINDLKRKVAKKDLAAEVTKVTFATPSSGMPNTPIDLRTEFNASLILTDDGRWVEMTDENAFFKPAEHIGEKVKPVYLMRVNQSKNINHTRYMLNQL